MCDLNCRRFVLLILGIPKAIVLAWPRGFAEYNRKVIMNKVVIGIALLATCFYMAGCGDPEAAKKEEIQQKAKAGPSAADKTPPKPGAPKTKAMSLDLDGGG